MSIIKVRNLKKNYDNIEVVKGISFDVEKGSFFAFLGTNGAGKSTTIDILTTLISKTSGDVTINGFELGKDDFEIKKSIGSVFQYTVLDDLLSIKENLIVHGKIYGLTSEILEKRIEEVANITDCHSFLNRKYAKLSGGQKRRADIACALINQPKILFLDEPTTGLDPATRLSIWDTIAKMQKDFGMTIFLTTHYMEEAAKADKIVILENGQILDQGTPYSLKEKYTSDYIKIYSPNDKIISYLENEKIKFKIIKNILLIEIKSYEKALDILYPIKNIIEQFEVISGNMGDVFINATNKKEEELCSFSL